MFNAWPEKFSHGAGTAHFNVLLPSAVKPLALGNRTQWAVRSLHQGKIFWSIDWSGNTDLIPPVGDLGGGGVLAQTNFILSNLKIWTSEIHIVKLLPPRTPHPLSSRQTYLYPSDPLGILSGSAHAIKLLIQRNYLYMLSYHLFQNKFAWFSEETYLWRTDMLILYRPI